MEKIKAWRILQGFSQKEMAQKLGISAETLCRIEKGRQPGYQTLKKIAKVTGIEIRIKP